MEISLSLLSGNDLWLWTAAFALMILTLFNLIVAIGAFVECFDGQKFLSVPFLANAAATAFLLTLILKSIL